MASLDTIPTSLPILALPNEIVFPGSQVTITVPRTLAGPLSRIVKSANGEAPLLVATPATTLSNSQGQPRSSSSFADLKLFDWGCVSRIVRLIRPTPLSPNTCILTLAGITRVQLEKPLPASSELDKLPLHPIHYTKYINSSTNSPSSKAGDGNISEHAAEAFRAAAARLLDRYDADSRTRERRQRGFGVGIDWRKLKVLVEDAETDKTPWVADILMAVLSRIPREERLQMLSTASPSDRLRFATSIFSKQASIAEVSEKINTVVDETLTKQQKEFYLRQQLQAIQQELANLRRSPSSKKSASSNNTSTSNGNKMYGAGGVGPETEGNARDGQANDEGMNNSNEFEEEGDDNEYFAEIRAKIETMQPGSEERKMGAKEFRRLKRIPAGSVEHGVLRTYLDWLTSLPWPSNNGQAHSQQSLQVISSSDFLTKARAQLEADHFGLDNIKRRLIEHLAVIRLKTLNQLKDLNQQKQLEAESARATTAQQAHSEQTTSGVASPTNAPTPTKESSGPAPLSSSPTKPRQSTPVVQKLNRKMGTKGPILLLVGPPGCGKTSIASSLAKALGRPFHRISLGGVRDEAEIRGHRRTYVASGPGSIVTAMAKVGCPDPVVLLDEIDKVGHASHQGDPASALLEVLDPEQNFSFKDHYINVPLDLSQVIFIATANSLDTISEPLLDRCEVIRLSGYTYDEKIHIARRFLLPKQLEANGLTQEQLTITDDAYMHIASYYTREAGVRSLERSIGSIARWKAVEWTERTYGTTTNSSASTQVDNRPETGQANTSESPKSPNTSNLTGLYNPIVDVQDLESILGVPRWDPSEKEREERRGLVYGLVVSGYGEGGVLPVESVFTSGTGQLRLTGSLGDVIRESGEIALSWVKAHAYQLGITSSPSQDPLKHYYSNDNQNSDGRKGKQSTNSTTSTNSDNSSKTGNAIDIHLHLPAGAIKKDGPSAGVAYICAFVSLLTGCTVPSDIAMTGETTLRGRITAVGGIKEKVLGAHREGINKVILPRANRKDVEHDVPKEIINSMEFIYVARVEEALEAAFGPSIFRTDHHNGHEPMARMVQVEPRL